MSQSTGPKPPQAPFDFTTLSPSVITKTVSDAIAKSKALEDQVAALKADDCTFDSVVLPLALDEGDIDVQTDSATFMQSVSPDKLSRDAATESQKQLSDYSIASSMRQDIFDALQHAQQNIKDGSLDAESQRLLDRMLLDKRRAGLGLSSDKQAQYKALKQEINAKCIEFRKNCDEEAGFLTFTKEELQGVPESVMKGYEQVEDNGVVRYKVTNKTPDIVPVMRYCQVPSTRRRSYINYENRNANNTQLFSEVIDLRRKAADVMGYATHADYVIEPKMAKTAKTVNDFLDDLHSKISTVGEKERDRLLELKKRDEEKLGLEHDPLFNAYDYRYLDRLYVEETLSLDDEQVKQYLPVEQVVTKTLALYEDLLGVQCFQSKDAPVWHPDVTAFAVWDREGLKSGENQQDAFQGWLYLDLFPRPGKYGHAAVFTLQPGFEKVDGSRSYPVCSMVANLAKPVAGQPALLSHYDFVTFFHEMGHAYHCLLSRTKYARFAGTRVARDFVEAPSQMLENWCFTPKVLKMVSKHHETGEAMPDDLIDKIVRSDAINKGLFNLRQLFFGKFDMAVHTSDKATDYTKLWNELREKIALTKLETNDLPEGQGSFAHLVGGYDAGYYGYLYSQSFSADMFDTVFSQNPLSTEKGSLYRNEILLPGGSRDEMDSLVAFLGRKPNNSAFLRKLLAGAST